MISLCAPAKLTLSLEIRGVRDDGYHLIEAEMVSLSLMDKLEVSDNEGKGGIEVSLEYSNEPWGFDPGSSVPDNENNLVSKALKLLNVEKSVHIRKKIPPGTGYHREDGNTDLCTCRWHCKTGLLRRRFRKSH